MLSHLEALGQYKKGRRHDSVGRLLHDGASGMRTFAIQDSPELAAHRARMGQPDRRTWWPGPIPNYIVYADALKDLPWPLNGKWLDGRDALNPLDHEQSR